jgi:tRNA-specific 2-thiouridylase
VQHREPLYVIGMNPYRNALIVGIRDELGFSSLSAKRVNWVGGKAPVESFHAEVKVRYKARTVPAWIDPEGGERFAVRFDEPVRDVTPGQGAVIYDGETCLGGGIIERAHQSDQMDEFKSVD